MYRGTSFSVRGAFEVSRRLIDHAVERCGRDPESQW